MRILAMDDAKLIQKVLRVLLASIPGAELDIAGSVEELLGHIKRQALSGSHYDLVLSDLNCPGLPQDASTQVMGGLQVVALLRRDPRNAGLRKFYNDIPMAYRAVPILIFTTETDEDLQNRAKGGGDPRMGANELLVKSEYLSSANQQAFIDIINKYRSARAN